jgi:Cft2 family RNA processing exonuclease
MIFNPPSILNFQGLELGLKAKTENVFVSHAHFDHITKKSRKTLASKETIDLMKARGVETQKIEKELKAELLNAGHVLGSRQLRVEEDIRKDNPS